MYSLNAKTLFKILSISQPFQTISSVLYMCVHHRFILAVYSAFIVIDSCLDLKKSLHLKAVVKNKNKKKRDCQFHDSKVSQFFFNK